MGILDSFKEFVSAQNSAEKSNNDFLKDCGSTEKIEDGDRKENISGSSDKASFQIITPKSISEKLLRHQIESELTKKYSDHRVALQSYSEKLALRKTELDARESSLNQREKELKTIEASLMQKGKSIEEREEEYSKQVKAGIKKYAEKKKKEIQQEAYLAQEKAKHDLEELKKYKSGLLQTEFTIMDWLDRVDDKEEKAFKEIQEGVRIYQEYNQCPPEDGFDFERKFAAALKRDGFENVTVTEKSGDFGADILAEKDGVKYVIQCKYYTSSVGVKAVQQVFASKIHYAAHVAVVATNSVFTKSAKVLAEETGVLLWNGLKVQEILSLNSG
ncbi:MAG: restriction endonuclease [Dysosmobacter sp.]|uniref:restriction endonuclease n=1 Tax=uncultured Oscillibacter sp. TaxID=876091 RepID=UPI002613C59F|nr:restriction endonuclease [uncultured Oscillibacter sp.]MCX4371952.1 restriction endonuclease [Dysosmobacter sp.]